MNPNTNSRSNRFEKKRKSTKWLTWLTAAGGVLIAAFILMFLFDGNESESTAQESEQASNSDEAANEEETASSEPDKEHTSKDLIVNDGEEKDENAKDKEDSKDKKDKEDQKDNSDVTIENSSDPNVRRVIKKDWEPLPTQQQVNGQHTIQYDTSSTDWAEMLQVVSNVTGIPEQNMEKWIANGGGPNKAVATVYNSENKNEIYRVYIQWVENKGFQAQKVEELNELPEDLL